MFKATRIVRPESQMTADGFYADFRRLFSDGSDMALSVQAAGSSLYPLSASRTEALHALETFLPRATRYARGRNFDIPGKQAVSQLSPFIRYRLLTEKETVNALLQRHDFRDAEKFIQEVCWRTYFKGYLEQHPGIWARYRSASQAEAHELSEASLETYARALRGETGINCFDSWVEELVTTGWLHNHARMWFASIWIFTLQLPWQLGAAFFLRHLLDGDPASNTLSWRWVGGLHTRGKHYLARASNIRRYTQNRFNPTHQLNENASPLPPDGCYERYPLSAAANAHGIDQLSLSNCPAGLLVTPEDLTPEISCLSEAAFSSICLVQGRDVLADYGASEKVGRFIAESIDDTAQRISAHWNGRIIACDSEVIPCVGKASPQNVGRKESMRIYAGQVDVWKESILTWARNENLNSIWMLQPPAGPWKDALDNLVPFLKQRGIRLLLFRRHWDDVHWPHARNGYFRFKKGLRERLQAFA